MPEGERDSTWKLKDESWKTEVEKSKQQQGSLEAWQQSTTKAPRESFSNWNSFKNSEQYKKLNWRLRKHIHICVWTIADSNFRKIFISALSKYINKYNTIDRHKVNEILQKEHTLYRRTRSIEENKIFTAVVKTYKASMKWAGNLFKKEETTKPSEIIQDNSSTTNTDRQGFTTEAPNNNPNDNTDNRKEEHENKKTGSEDKNSNPDTLTSSLSKDNSNFKEEIEEQLDALDKDQVQKVLELLEWNKDGPKTGSTFTAKQLFVKEKWYKEKDWKIPDLERDYQIWNKKRLDGIDEIINPNYLWLFTSDEQTLKNPWVAGSTPTQEMVEWEQNGVTYDTVEATKAYEKLSRYTKGEIIWEFLSRKDIDQDQNMLYLQIIIAAFLKKEHILDNSFLTWEWNTKTQLFLKEKILNDPDFKKEPNYEKYKAAIEKVLADHDNLDTSWEDDIFETFSESVRRDEEYWKDPEAFWRKQTIEWQREFVWITDAVHRTSYEQWQKSFIENNMKGFNKKIEDFLTLPKLQEWETPNTDTKAKMDQIWNAIPIEQLDSIYEKFASNPEEQKKFKEFLKNNNIPDTDLQDASLRSFVIRKNLSLNPAAEYCYQRLWTCLQEQITWEAGKTLQYLSDKTWDTAFNIKNKVLGFFLPGISIHPENSEDWIFYFRDENNLDTLYWFNPEDWKIFQKWNISLWEDGIIKFWANKAEWNLLKQIHGFQDMISFELWDILPDKNARNVDELEKQITRKIESKINVESVVDTSVVSQALLKKENEKNVCRDRIVWDIKYLLDIQKSELHSWDWEKYKIFRSLVKTFEKIKVENPNDNTPLVTMKEFLDKVYSSANQWSLLKPSHNFENTEERSDDNLPQEGENLSVENHPQEMWKTILLKNLIDPQTQFFDISLITTLNQDKEINDSLAKRDFNNVIWKIAKRKDLQELDEDTDNQISQLTEKTWEELRWLYEETQLLASIDALEKQGDFLS